MNATQFLSIIKSRFWLIFFTLVITVVTTIMVSLNLPKEYTARTTLIVDLHEPVVGTMIPVQMASNYMATQIDIIQSHNVAKKVVNDLKLDENEAIMDKYYQVTEGRGDIKNWLADVLLEKLKVTPSRESRAVTIAYSSTDPEQAAAIANAFAHAYGETNLELSVEPAKRTAQWFGKQLVGLRNKVEAAQKIITDYQQKHGIFSTDEKLDIETTRLAEFSRQLVMAEATTRVAESNKSEMDKLISRGASLESMPEVQKNAFIQKLKVELLSREANLIELSNQYGTKHPQYIRARKEVGDLRAKLRREIKRISESINNNLLLAQSTELALGDDVKLQRQRVMALKQSRNQLPVLERELLSAHKAYELALQRLNDNTLQSRMSAPNISILNPAIVPIKPSSPKLMLNLVLSIFLGTILGLGFAFMRELMDRRIRSEADLTEGFGLNLLGILNKEAG